MSVHSGTITSRSVHPASPVLLRFVTKVQVALHLLSDLGIAALIQTANSRWGLVRSLSDYIAVITHTLPHVTGDNQLRFVSHRDCPSIKLGGP